MNNLIGVALVKEICLICGKELEGPIIMNTTLTKQNAKEVEELHNKVIGFAEKPCDECAANLKQAFLFIGYDEEKSDLKNLPQGFYRTGHIVGTKKDIPLVQEFIKEHQPNAIKKGFIFMPHTMMGHFGLIEL
jgi:hypothetical protein